MQWEVGGEKGGGGVLVVTSIESSNVLYIVKFLPRIVDIALFSQNMYLLYFASYMYVVLC